MKLDKGPVIIVGFSLSVTEHPEASFSNDSFLSVDVSWKCILFPFDRALALSSGFCTGYRTFQQGSLSDGSFWLPLFGLLVWWDFEDREALVSNADSCFGLFRRYPVSFSTHRARPG